MELLKEEKEEIQQVMNKFDENLKKVEVLLKPVFKTEAKDVISKLNEYERAKFNIVVAYSINTLFYSTIYGLTVNLTVPSVFKGSGNRSWYPPSERRTGMCSRIPSKRIKERVKLYVKTLKDITEKQKVAEQNLKLNVSAANRFIAHALNPTNTSEHQAIMGDKPSETNPEAIGSTIPSKGNQIFVYIYNKYRICNLTSRWQKQKECYEY